MSWSPGFGIQNVGNTSTTPLSGGATKLRVKSGGNDAAAGSGARQVTIQGLDENLEEVTETLEVLPTLYEGVDSIHSAVDDEWFKV